MIRAKYLELAVASGMILLFGGAAYQHNSIWKDEFSLWSYTASQAPHNARARRNLGFDYYKRGLYANALEEYKAALRLNPEDIDLNYNLGLAYHMTRSYDDAIRHYQKFLEIYEKHPRSFACTPIGRFYAEAYNNIGVCYFMKGDRDRAIEYLRKALSLDPAHADALYNLEVLLKK